MPLQSLNATRGLARDARTADRDHPYGAAQQAVRDISAEAERAVAELVVGWYEQMEAGLRRVRASLESAPPPPPASPLVAMTALLGLLGDWFRSSDADLATAYPGRAEAVAAAWAALRNHLRAQLHQLPTQVALPFDRQLWRPRAGDDAGTRLWKRIGPALVWAIHQGDRASWAAGLRGRPRPHRLPARVIPLQRYLQWQLDGALAPLLAIQVARLGAATGAAYRAVHAAAGKVVSGADALGNVTANGGAAEATSAPLQAPHAPLASDLDAVVERFAHAQQAARDHIGQRIDVARRRATRLLNRAGTPTLPNRLYTGGRIRRIAERASAAVEASAAKWATHVGGEHGDAFKDLGLGLLRVETTGACNATIDTIVHRAAAVVEQLRAPRELLEEARESFAAAGAVTEAELRDDIQHTSRRVVRTLRRQTLPALADALAATDIPGQLDNFRSRVAFHTEQLPEQQTVFRRIAGARERIAGRRVPLPRSSTVKVDLRRLIIGEILPATWQQYDAANVEVASRVTALARELAEIDEIVEFSLEAALAAADQAADQAATADGTPADGATGDTAAMSGAAATSSRADVSLVVTGGIGRALAKLEALEQEVQQTAGIAVAALRAATTQIRRDVAVLASSREVLALRLRVARAQAVARARALLTAAVRSAAAVAGGALRNAAQALSPMRRRYRDLTRAVGIAGDEADAERRLHAFVADRRRRIEALPQVYRRLFANEPVTDQRFLTGRAEELAALADAYSAWRAHRPAATVIVGENGSGRSTLAGFALQQMATGSRRVRVRLDARGGEVGRDPLRALAMALELDGASSVEQIAVALRSDPAGCIVLVEDLQNAFLRTVEGFDQLERFIALVTNTWQSVLWIVTCTVYSWRYLDRVLSLRRAFDRTVTLSEPPTLHELILTRHRFSGFAARFVASPAVAGSRRYRSLRTEQERQAYLQQLAFQTVGERAKGNVSIAMLVWQDLIREVDGDTIVLATELDQDFSFLNNLPGDEVFTLAALLQHGSLSADEHAAVFRGGRTGSAMLLEGMESRGLLIEKAGRYTVSLLVYRPVVATLEAKNVLH